MKIEEWMYIYDKPVDTSLMPTYEGGCPSRFVKPEGYDSGVDYTIMVNVLGRTYDGKVISYYTKGSRHDNPQVNRLMEEIDERATHYGS